MMRAQENPLSKGAWFAIAGAVGVGLIGIIAYASSKPAAASSSGPAPAASLVQGHRYSITGPNVGAPTSVSDAQNQLNTVAPGIFKVVSLTTGNIGETTIVFDVIGAPGATNVGTLQALGVTVTDLGPTPAGP